MDRFYRKQFKTRGLFHFQVKVRESDLYFVCDKNLESVARQVITRVRDRIERYCSFNREFQNSLAPVVMEHGADPLINAMAEASKRYDVGPMASVAGAVASAVGEDLSGMCSHLIVENGGDIWLKSPRPVTLEVYTGNNSPFAGKLRFQTDPAGEPLGICTSSGRIGHSLSFGNADAVVAVSGDVILADAAATAIANRVKSASDVETVLEQELQRGLLKGLIIVIDDKMGAWGDLKFV